MNLNLSFIEDGCEELSFEGKVIDSPNVAECEYPLFVRELPLRLDPKVLYVTDAERLSESALPRLEESNARDGSAHPSILCSGKPDDRWLQAPINLLYTLGCQSASDLMNDAVLIFARYARWERDLQHVVDDQLPIEELARLSVDMFGNPILTDTNFFASIFRVAPACANSIESTSEHGILDSKQLEDYMRIVINGQPDTGGKSSLDYDLDTICMLLGDPDFADAHKTRGAAIYPGKPFGYRTLYCNCRLNETPVARILVDEVIRPIRNSDYVLLSTLAGYITKMWSTLDANCFDLPKDYANVVGDLLSHKYVVLGRIEALMNGMGWHMDDDYMVILLGNSIFEEDGDDSLTHLSLSLSRLYHFMHFTRMKNHSVLVCNITKSGKSRDDVISVLATPLREQMVRATFSAKFYDFKSLYYYYRLALATEKAGMREDPMIWLYRQEEYAMSCVIDACLQDMLPEAIMPDGLHALIAHDEKKDTSYVDLLRIYLDNDRSITRTAREAYLHRNTCLYQVDRIKEITHTDFEDADDRLVMQIALRILERTASVDEDSGSDD